MAEKSLSVRIRNKYDSYENWANSNLVLESGEIAVAYTTIDVYVGNGQIEQHPELLMKVGNGSDAFVDLPWLSAKAADVADWAKAANKPSYSVSEITDMSTYTASVTELQRLVGDTAVSVQIADEVSKKADAEHDHNYAGSSTSGGAATSAEKLEHGLTIQKYSVDGAAAQYTYDGSSDKTLIIDLSNLVASVNGVEPDANGNVEIEVSTTEVTDDGSGNVTVESISITGGDSSGLPSVTSSDNGKILCVVNGAWTATTVQDAEELSF